MSCNVSGILCNLDDSSKGSGRFQSGGVQRSEGKTGAIGRGCVQKPRITIIEEQFIFRYACGRRGKWRYRIEEHAAVNKWSRSVTGM